MKDWILVLDSGVGGVSVLNKILKTCPNHNYIYFADSKFAPYGNKSPKRLKKHLKALIRKLTKLYDIKIVVLACNTATAICIDDLRVYFKDIIFIGIEPAIKQAYKKCKKILVLATVSTINNSKVLKKYNFDNVTLFPLKYLAKMIDDNLDNLSLLLPTLKSQFKITNYDGVVLGCTHYVFLKKYLKKIFKNAQFFESSMGVARRLKNILKQLNISTQKNTSLLTFSSNQDVSTCNKIKKFIKML